MFQKMFLRVCSPACLFFKSSYSISMIVEFYFQYPTTDLSHSDTRLSVMLNGFELHVYNRSHMYAILERVFGLESHLFPGENPFKSKFKFCDWSLLRLVLTWLLCFHYDYFCNLCFR